MSLSTTSPASPKFTPILMLAIAGVVVVLALGWFLLLRTVWNMYVEVADEVRAKREGLALIEDVKTKLDSQISSWSGVSAEMSQRLSLALPSGTDIPNLIAQVEELAQTEGFTISNLNISSPPARASSKLEYNESGEVVGVREGAISQGPQVEELQLNLNISGGDYETLKRFIANSEKALRLMELTSLSFTTVSSAAAGGQNSYVVNFKVPYLSKSTTGN